MKREKTSQPNFQKILLSLILILVFSVLIIFPILQNLNIGMGDFRPYWSASYLLQQGQDFSDPALMDEIERTLTGWKEPSTMMAWFAPTGMIILLPFTVLPFNQAAFFWLLTNIFVLSLSAFLLWHTPKKKFWIPLVVVFGFPMTLLSLYVGQINTLVLLGLSLYISLEKPKHQYWRGIGLALTTIKPHLVILTLPLILLDCIYKKQWKILIGFLGSLLFSSIILTALHPSWLNSFCDLITSGMSSIRETPTISGLIVHSTGQIWGKWIWIPILIIAIIFEWFYKEKWNTEKILYQSIPISLLISPVGWGYDQIILLILILNILKQTQLNEINKKKLAFMILITLILYGIIFVMRINSPNEVWFVWVPIFFFITNLILFDDKQSY